MIGFDPLSTFVLCLVPIVCVVGGYWLGRMASTPTIGRTDPRLAYTHAERLGFTFGIVAALAIIQSKTGPPSRSPPVSGTGSPVAGAGGETG